MLRDSIRQLVKDHGFIPHVRCDKTRVMGRGTGQEPEVTGLVIRPDGRITIGPDKVARFRARLHQALEQSTWDDHTRGEVAGTIGFLRQVYGDDTRRLPAKLRTLVTAARTRLGHPRRKGRKATT